MSKAIRMHETGGPEVLRWEEVTIGPPGPGEVHLRQSAVGHSGLYRCCLFSHYGDFYNFAAQ